METINRQYISEFFSTNGAEIYRKAESCLIKYGMIDLLESGVLVGLSGGADSVMLLCFLVEYRHRVDKDFTIAAAHVNHGIRGDEADRDENFSRELCRSLDVEFLSYKVSVPAIAESQGTGIEETARNIRYIYFRDIIQGRNDISSLAVAHNMSDNAETVMFNILRGSGSRGASGIKPVRDNIIRPLIEVRKSEILSAMQDHIPFVTDSTNASCDYTRNYIRNEIIPSFEKICDNPENMIHRFSLNLRGDDEFISSVANDFLEGKQRILNSDLASLHFSVFVRVLSRLSGFSEGNISLAVASDVYALLNKDNFTYSLGKGRIFICEHKICRVIDEVKSDIDYRFDITFGFNGFEEFAADIIISNVKFEKTYLNVYKTSIQANLSSAIIDGSLFIRPKMDGDSIYYGGMTHKLKKLFNDRKIPPSMRKLVPVLCDNKGVVWVPGFGVRDDRPSASEKKDLFIMIGIRSDEQHVEHKLCFGSDFG